MTDTQRDSEIAAMEAIVSALEPLEPVARKRVLEWAELRYSRPPSTLDPEWMNGFTTALQDAATKIGGLTPRDVLVGAEEIARMRADSTKEETG